MAAAHKSRTSDQYNLEARLEQLIHHHLLDLEENPEMYAAKDRLSTIQYVGMFLNRKFGWGESEAEGAGSSVRKYSRAAFQTPPTHGPTHGSGRRAADSRSSNSNRISVVPADTTGADPDTDNAAA